MEFIQIVVLAVVQGLTEFLPISSSAHLILVPVLLDWPDQGLAFDVAVHVGTLTAVVTYFREELMAMFRDWLGSLAGGGLRGDARLAWGVLLGTLPAALAGLLFHETVETTLRSPLVIAWATIGFGVLLGVADYLGRRGGRSEHQLTWIDVMVVGLAQALALVPGTSRSGITMTAALFLGFSREGAARFSFLLSIPLILLAGGYEARKLVLSESPVDWSVLGWGILLSAISAYLCIHYFLKIIRRMGMQPFVVYRLLLGGYLLWVFA